MTTHTAQEKQSRLTPIFFWLFVPIGGSFLISALLRAFISPKLSLIGIAALVYAVFSMIVITTKQHKVVKGLLLFVNLATFAIFGYFQTKDLMPETWPVWTPTAVAITAAVLWIFGFITLVIRLGKKAHGNTVVKNHHEGEKLAEQLEEGKLDATVREQIMAAIKLSSSRGDVTVDAAEMIRQLAMQSVSKDRESRAQLAESMMKAMQSGIFEAEDRPMLRKAIRSLYQLEDGDVEELTSENPVRRIVEEAKEGLEYITIDWGLD